MAVKITLNGKSGVDYDAYMADYFSDFTMAGFPIFLGGKGQYDGKQLLLLEQDQGSATKSLILEGKSLSYDFAGHTLSGNLTKVTFATLGKSYKKGGEFKLDKKGLIKGTTDTVEMKGLAISNPKDVRGDLHDTIYALMGGGHGSGGLADPGLLLGYVKGQSQKVKGTKKDDKFTGGDAADKIKLDKGDDVLDGGLGNDTLTGGAGRDTFVFSTALGAGNVDKITDFSAKDDSISLSSSVFAGLAPGKLAAASFVVGSAATDADDRIIYDKASGALSFDADGNGSGSAVQFADIGKNLGIDAGNFLVV